MNNQPSLHIGLTCQTLQEAYERLGIKDTSTPDGDVVAAFYEVYSTSTSTHDPGRKRLLAVKALEVISHRRQSQLLAFIRTIVSHLTQDNVLLLAPPPSSNFVNLTSDEAVEQTSNEQHSRSPGSPGATISYQASPTISSTGPSDNEVTLTPASGEDEDTAEAFSDRMSLVSEKTSSTGIGISSSEASSEEGSDQSDFDHPVGGKYWDGQHWCCEECNDELEDGRCPSGCPINPCRICGQECGLACPVACPICDNELATLCSGCHKSKGDYEKSSSDDCVMVRDELDKVWRCKDCLWEVEANSENEGHCHCRVDPNDSSPISTVPAIELLYYHDYEPADSDSSGPESVDSEPDSDDEAFIEDDGPFRPEVLGLHGLLPTHAESHGLNDATTLRRACNAMPSVEDQPMDVTCA